MNHASSDAQLLHPIEPPEPNLFFIETTVFSPIEGGVQVPKSAHVLDLSGGGVNPKDGISQEGSINTQMHKL